MKYILLFCLFFSTMHVFAKPHQSYCNLKITYPEGFIYDSLSIIDSHENAINYSTVQIGSNTTKTYLLPLDSVNMALLSIVLGKSESNHFDTLPFYIDGKNASIEFDRSFSIDRPLMQLTNAYNFESLYFKFVAYRDSAVKRFDDKINDESKTVYTPQGYFAKVGFDFVKQNRANPYAPYLFIIPVIHPPGNFITYDEAYGFYKEYLEPEIKYSGIKDQVENSLSTLKLSLRAGVMLPQFKAQSIQGKVISHETYRGKFVLYTFWASWCGPCIQELPTLRKIRSKYPDEKFVIVGISLDTDSTQMIKAIESAHLNWPQIFGRKDIINQFSINAIPVNLLVNGEGKIIYNSFLDEKQGGLGSLVRLLKSSLNEDDK